MRATIRHIAIAMAGKKTGLLRLRLRLAGIAVFAGILLGGLEAVCAPSRRS